MSLNIVQADEQGDLFTTSEAIAEGAGIQHKNVLEAIAKYHPQLSELGEVAFQTRPGYNNASVRFYRLNEQQATLILTLARNTAEVVAFKVALVKEFSRLASAVTAPSFDIPKTLPEALRAYAEAEEQRELERERRLELEGPAAEREFYRSSEGLQLIDDVANRFKAYAKDRYPGVKVLNKYVWEQAGRLGIIIRGNTIRHNQPTAQAVTAGWAKPSESHHETNTRGTVRTVTTRLTPKGEARLWDGLVRFIQECGSLDPNAQKGIAA